MDHSPVNFSLGSSPLARGLQEAAAQHVDDDGIIPARAGFTPSVAGINRMAEDHPRSRGVYLAREYGVSMVLGSSPLARGLPARPPTSSDMPRIIPARAGFTRVRTSPWARARDHPRSRGVYLFAKYCCGLSPGSSPLARGLRGSVAPAVDNPGIIPARAGFTQERCGLRGLQQDHPRSRGVYLSTTTTPSSQPGSSPLARGLHVASAAAAGGGGIIPARAGFTM